MAERPPVDAETMLRLFHLPEAELAVEWQRLQAPQAAAEAPAGSASPADPDSSLAEAPPLPPALVAWNEEQRMRALMEEATLPMRRQLAVKAYGWLKDVEWRDPRWSDLDGLRAGEAEAMYDVVVRLARRMGTHLPAGVSVEDLAQEGHLALLQASRRYDPQRSPSLRAFCVPRIKGAMVDYLRRHSPVSRQDQAQATAMAGAYGRLQQALGRVPSTDEVARELQVTGSDLQGLLTRLTLATVVSLQAALGGEEPADGRAASDPAAQAVRRDQTARLHAGVRQLAPREQLLVYLHYFEDVSFSKIGALLGLQPPRVTELHHTLLARLLGFLETGILRAPQRGRPFM